MLAENHERIYERSFDHLTTLLAQRGHSKSSTYPYLVYMGNWMADYSQFYSPELAETIVGMIETRGYFKKSCTSAKKDMEAAADKAVIEIVHWIARTISGGSELIEAHKDLETAQKRLALLKEMIKEAKHQNEATQALKAAASAGLGTTDKKPKITQAQIREIQRLIKADLKKAVGKAKRGDTVMGHIDTLLEVGTVKALLQPVHAAFDEIVGPLGEFLESAGALGDLMNKHFSQNNISDGALSAISAIQYMFAASMCFWHAGDLENIHDHKLSSDGTYAKNFVPLDTMAQMFVTHFGRYLPHEHLDRPPLNPVKTNDGHGAGDGHDHSEAYRKTLRAIQEEIRTTDQADIKAIKVVQGVQTNGPISLDKGQTTTGIDKHLRDDIGIALRRLFEMREGGGSNLGINDRLVQIGKALHAVQDYFAHTNSIDRMIYLSKLDCEDAFKLSTAQLVKIYRSLLDEQAATKLENNKKADFVAKVMGIPQRHSTMRLTELLKSELSPLIYAAYFDPVHGVIHSLTLWAENKIVQSLELDENLQDASKSDIFWETADKTFEKIMGFSINEPPSAENVNDMIPRVNKVLEAFNTALSSDDGLMGYLIGKTFSVSVPQFVDVDSLDQLWRAANGLDPQQHSSDNARLVMSIMGRFLDLLFVVPFILKGMSSVEGIRDDLKNLNKIVEVFQKLMKLIKAIRIGMRAVRKLMTGWVSILAKLGKDAAIAYLQTMMKEKVKDLFLVINGHLKEPHGSHALIAKDESVQQEQRYYFAEDMAVLMDHACYDLAFGELSTHGPDGPDDPPVETGQPVVGASSGSPNGAAADGAIDLPSPQDQQADALGRFASFMAKLTNNAVQVARPDPNEPLIFDGVEVSDFAGWQTRFELVQYKVPNDDALHGLITSTRVDTLRYWHDLDFDARNVIAKDICAANEGRVTWNGFNFAFDVPMAEYEPFREVWAFQMSEPVFRMDFQLRDNTNFDPGYPDPNSIGPPLDIFGAGHSEATVSPWYSYAADEYREYVKSLTKDQDRPYTKTKAALEVLNTDVIKGHKEIFANELFRLKTSFAAHHRERMARSTEFLKEACPRMTPVLSQYRGGWNGKP